MLRRYLIFAYITAYLIVISSSQEIIRRGLRRANATSEDFVTTETIQSDLWLIARDDPVPVQLNRQWSPESGMPGVQHVAAFHRNNYGSRLRNNQIPESFNARSENQNLTDEHIFFPQDQRHVSYNVHSPSDNRRQTTNSNLDFQSPEAVLLELPMGLTSGLWERARPELMYQMSPSGRRVGTSNDQSVVQLDNEADIQQDQPAQPDSYLPIRDATTRLPLSDLVPQMEDNPVGGALYNVPYQTFLVPAENAYESNSSIYNNATPISSRQDIWLPIQGRTSAGNPSEITENGDKLLYEISFDDIPARREPQPEVGLTLTKDDIEILEKLGILSSLTSDSIVQGLGDSVPNIENSQREYESNPHLIDNGGQSYSLVPDDRYTNLSDVVFLEVPEFVTSDYHGNVHSTEEHRDHVRLEPYIFVDSYGNPNIESHINESSPGVHEYNASSLSFSQIHEILQLLGLNTPETLNASSVAEPEPKLESMELKNVSSSANQSTPAKEVQPTAEGNVDETIIIPEPNSTTVVSESPRASQDVTNEKIEERSTPMPGLVSSGRIQPRLLDSLPTDRSEKENEIMELISRRMSSISEQKMEMLQKLNLKPKPYVFAFKQNDGNGTLQHRNETSDASGVVQGTYGYRDPFGLYRNVNYIADRNGFHAVVRTNEPGTISHNPADALFMSELPPQAAIAQMMAYAKARATRAP